MGNDNNEPSIDGNASVFIISQNVPQRNGLRRVQIGVRIETVKKLAEILQHTSDAGHASWHLNNPASPLPCSVCKGP